MAISAGACGGDPYDSAIVATIEGVWRAAGIDPADTYLRSYQRHTHENATVCQHLPTEERWFADRLGFLASNVAPQGQIYDGALAYLEGEGFTIERYEARHPEVDRPALRAVRADLAVLVTVAEDGNTALDVSAGPCAVQLSTFSEDLYRRVD